MGIAPVQLVICSRLHHLRGVCCPNTCRLHCTDANELLAQATFLVLQILMAMVLSVAQGASVCMVAVTPWSAAEYALQHGSITSKLHIRLHHRAIAAVGVALGAILGGRLQARTIGTQLQLWAPPGHP